MTRETKIGLLVGLAFIIVIGILLSDHLTSTTEPQQAQLGNVGNTVRTAVTVPGGSNPPITTVVTPPVAVAPTQTVPSKEEITPRQPPIEIVKIGGAAQPPAQKSAPSAGQPSAIASGASAHAAEPAPERAVAIADGDSAAIRRVDAPSSLAGVARSMGAEIVPAGKAIEESAPAPAPVSTETSREQIASALSHTTGGTSASAGASGAVRQYKAEPGDSVSRIAAKCLGANTKANREALIAANPSLQQDANMVIAGKTYTIPAAPESAASATQTNASAPQAVASATNTSAAAASVPSALKAPAAEVASSPEYFYSVKAGDTLTKIAVMQLGTPGAVEAIKDLNKDMLKGGDTIRPNMKLRLPAKPLASAAQ